MRRQLLRMICVLTLLLVGGACAQTISVRTDIPFAFVVNGETVPAGQYTVELESGRSPLLVRGVNSAEGVWVLSNSTESLEASGKTKLLFHRYGNQYFLAQIWIGGERLGRELPESKRETELAKAYTRHDASVTAGMP